MGEVNNTVLLNYSCQILDVNTKKIIYNITWMNKPIKPIGWSKDGTKILLLIGEFSEGEGLLIWDVIEQDFILSYLENSINNLFVIGWTSNFEKIVFDSDPFKPRYIWETQINETKIFGNWRFNGAGSNVNINPDDDWFALSPDGEKILQIKDFNTESILKEYNTFEENDRLSLLNLLILIPSLPIFLITSIILLRRFYIYFNTYIPQG